MERTMDRTTRLAEETALAWQLYDDNIVNGYEDALKQAHRQVDELLAFAEQWDAAAAAPVGASIDAPKPTGDVAQEPVYVPSALEPHEQRAVDKALYQRAAGVVPRLVVAW